MDGLRKTGVGQVVPALAVASAAGSGVGDDPAADQFGYLGDDGVSESSKSVHPMGNPMNHSAH
jgi:hypothetical protein